MRTEDCFWFGSITKAHGIKGEVKAIIDVDDINDYKNLESVYLLQKNKLTPFFIEKIRIQGPDSALISFKNIITRNDSEELAGTDLYLPLDMLPELEEDQFYYHEIIGFTVEDEVLGTLGTVLRIEEKPAQDQLIMEYKDKEVSIPVVDEIVLGVDREAKVLHTHLPEGLLEIYL